MSRTIGSPARMTRSDASWWDDAEFGPEATIANRPTSWPSATSRSRTSRATSASVRPISVPAAIDATTRSAAWAASRSRAISSASLTIRSSRRTGEAGSNRALGPEMLLELQEVDGPQAVRDRDPRSGVARRGRDAAGDDGVRVVELAPRHDLDRGAQALLRRAALEPRDHDERRLPADDREHRQPLERHRLVGRQVAEVRPDADQQGIEAVGRRRLDGATQPLGVPGRRDGGSSRDDRHDAASTAATRSIQAEIVAGPSSASLR